MSGTVCAQGDFQCAENHGGWALADFDILLVIAPNGLTGGWNGTATVNGHPINTGFVGDSAGACQWQTTYAGHEVFEAQTDGISADCCDGELPFQTAACHAPTQSYGGADAHACAKSALRWSRYDAVASAPRRSRLGRPPPLPLVRRARSSSGLTNWPV